MAAPSEVDEDVAYLLDGTTTSVEGGTGNEFELGGDALEELCGWSRIAAYDM